MIEREKRQVFYETEGIKKITCDICESDITERKFFMIELSFRELNESKTQHCMVYDENKSYSHICETCAKKVFSTLPVESISEYILESI